MRAELVSRNDAAGPLPERFEWVKRLPRRVGRWVRSSAGALRAPAPAALPPLALPFNQEADVLLIVPPFASLWYPSLGAHVLQGCIRRADFRMDVLYANILLASTIGESSYEKVAAESVALVAERFFARSAFDLPPLGYGGNRALDPTRIYGEEKGQLYRGLVPDGKAATLGGVTPITIAELERLEAAGPAWIDRVATAIAARRYKIVGCTTTFQQTTASIALLKRIKSLDPGVVTVLGGANCEGEMAEGLLALGASVDYIFSGESEGTFPEFVRAVMAGERPTSRIVYGRPCDDMDGLPSLQCAEFFQQRSAYLPNSVPLESTFLTYETSRGCWWGQKQHCTFCGLNGEGMAFRRKSPDRVIDELRTLLEASPTKNISMTDNIMPHDYFRTLLPRLREELPGLNIFYEQKSNLSFEDVLALKDAGVTTIQPGIEALSTPLLKLMKKGVNARQNLMLLRYGRIAGVRLVWNLICGFPNDEFDVYRETRALVPLIVHLQPPSGLWHLSIDRFSPYFVQPALHDVTDVRPLPVYRDFLPESADTARIAYHFLGDYPSDTHRFIEPVRELGAQVRAWARAWEREYRRRPELKICRHEGRYLLVDMRGLPGTEALRALDRTEAALLLSAGPYRGSKEEDRAVDQKLAVVVDQWFVPLPVARQDVFLDLSSERPGRQVSDTEQLYPLTALRSRERRAPDV